MRRLSLGLLAVVVALGALVAIASPAAACPDGDTPVPGTGGQICIPAEDPGSPATSGPGGGGGPQTCTYEGRQIPCQDPMRGNWYQSRGCYILLISPQPDPASEVWNALGGSPQDGRIFLCIRPGTTGTQSMVFIRGGSAPDPAVLARKALGELRLVVPDVHLAPSPPARTYVGLKTWLWVPAGQWSPLSKSVTAGATTVRVVAVPRRVVWDMGPGSTTCHSVGRVWRVGQMPAGSATDCSYTYATVSNFQRSKKFTVSATITYQVDWTCSGTCLAGEGTLGEVDGLPGTSAIAVGERQSVVVNGDGR